MHYITLSRKSKMSPVKFKKKKKELVTNDVFNYAATPFSVITAFWGPKKN